MKKLFLLFLVCLLAFSFVACNDETPVPPETPKTKVSTAEELKAAIDAKDQNVIVLADDIDYSTSDNLKVSDAKIKLDLNGHSLKLANTGAKGRMIVGENGVFTLMDNSANKDGKIYTETEYTDATTGFGIIEVVSNGKFIMNSGNIDTALENATKVGQFAIGISDKAEVVINDGTIKAGWYAVSGNGLKTADDTKVTVNGGKLVSTADYAIYMPAPGTITVNGGLIDGAAGAACLRSGSLIVNDGTLQSAGTGDTGNWGDGTSSSGNALIVAERNGQAYAGNVEVTLKGGNFVGNTEIEENLKVCAESKLTIEGGTFNFNPATSLIADGYEVKANAEQNTWTVVKK